MGTSKQGLSPHVLMHDNKHNQNKTYVRLYAGIAGVSHVLPSWQSKDEAG
jgi:hypothetical protein